MPVYKGSYTETLTAAIAAFRAKQSPAHRAGVRGRHRHHDGRQGRGLSGLSADGRHRRGVRSQGLYRPRSTATTRRPTASCCRCRSTPRPRCSTGTRTLFKKAGLDPEQAADDLAGGGRDGQEARSPSGAQVRVHDRSGRPGRMIENFGAWHNLPFATKAERLRRPRHRAEIQRRRRASSTSTSWPSGEGQGVRLRRPRGQADGACSPPASARMHIASSGSARRRQGSAQGQAFGIGMMPYWPDVAAKPQNSIIGGATLVGAAGQAQGRVQGRRQVPHLLSQPAGPGQVAPGDRLRADHARPPSS